jgi:hypothetical protein
MYNLTFLVEDQNQRLKGLVDRVIVDEVLNQDQEYHQVIVAFLHQVQMDLKQQQVQELLLVHEIVVE